MICAKMQVLQQLTPEVVGLLEPYLIEATDLEQAAPEAPEQGMQISPMPLLLGRGVKASVLLWQVASAAIVRRACTTL